MLTTINDKVRYLNKNNNANERENFSKWWKEHIEHYGTSVTYYTHGYSLTSHNFLYGEDPTAPYKKTPELIMFTDITNDAIMLSKFGIMADCDLTAVIHISSFYDKLGCGSEPKAGDLIELTEYGADRPGGRSAPIYEITERDDEYLAMTNPLIGHYVWHIKCKRFEYSYEPGIRDQPNNKQLSDGGDYGRLAGGENPEVLFQSYPDSVQNSAKCIYDYYSDDPTGLEVNPNHFVPPSPPSCPENLVVTGLSAVPGPYEDQEIFTAEDAAFLSMFNNTLSANEVSNEINDLAKNISLYNNTNDVLLRTLASNENGDKTFVIQTSGKPEDMIKYTTNLSAIQLFDAFLGGIT